MTFCACTSSGETASASSSTVSSPAAAVSCGRNPMVAFFSIAIVPLSGEVSPRINENKVDLPAPFGPTNPIRSPRLTWSDTSSKSARPAKDFESCETVSITESAQCSLVRRPAQLALRQGEFVRLRTTSQLLVLTRSTPQLRQPFSFGVLVFPSVSTVETNVECLDTTPFFHPKPATRSGSEIRTF